jgi:type II secretory pathway pseudopilin PulG
MNKQRGFTGIEIVAILAVIVAAVMYVPKALEYTFQTACESAGYEWSSDPAVGCSGLPRKGE